MSLESNIGDLVTATNALLAAVSSKMADINGAVAKAIAAVPANKRTWYINQQTGLDTNDGSAAAPLKTLSQAISNTPHGGYVLALLQADYTMTADIRLEGRNLEFRTDTLGTKRSLRLAYVPTAPEGTASYLTGLICSLGGLFALRDVKLVFPTANGVVPVPSGFTNSFFKGDGAGGSPVVGMKMTSVDVEEAAGATGCLCGQGTAALALEVSATTFPTGFAGRYVYGVAAGTAPNTLPNLLTNIPSL